MIDAFLSTFITLLVIVDPFGNLPIFLVLTKREPERRNTLALETATAVALIITVFAVFGRLILAYLHISLDSLATAGGILLLSIALHMVLGQPFGESDSEISPGWVPLGTPLMAGPGAIAATMVALERARGFEEILGVGLGILALVTVSWLTLRSAIPIYRVLKETGVQILSRVMGLLLAAIAVQLVFTGIGEWIKGIIRSVN